MSALANACKAINNAARALKKQVFIQHTSPELRDFLIEMKKHGYISSLTFVQGTMKVKAVIGLNGRLTKCAAICPHFRYKAPQIPGVSARLRPARQFGHVLFKTSHGVVDQNEANKVNTGGSILGFFY